MKSSSLKAPRTSDAHTEPTCCVLACESNEKIFGKVPLFSIPSSPNQYKLWSEVIPSESRFLQINKSFVCLKHFQSDDYDVADDESITLHETAVPSIFPNYESYRNPIEEPCPCCADGCNSNRWSFSPDDPEDYTIPVFPFPIVRDLRNKWSRVTPMRSFNGNEKVLCIKHFHFKDYSLNDDDTIILNLDAVPSIFKNEAAHSAEEEDVKPDIPFKILDVRSINEAAMGNDGDKLVQIPLSTIAISMEDCKVEGNNSDVAGPSRVTVNMPGMMQIKKEKDEIPRSYKNLRINPMAREFRPSILQTPIKQERDLIPLGSAESSNRKVSIVPNKKIKTSNSDDDDDNDRLIIDDTFGIEDIFSSSYEGMSAHQQQASDAAGPSNAPAQSTGAVSKGNRRKQNHQIQNIVEDIVFEESDNSAKVLTNKNLIKQVAFLRSSINYILGEMNHKPMVFKQYPDSISMIEYFNTMESHKMK